MKVSKTNRVRGLRTVFLNRMNRRMGTAFRVRNGDAEANWRVCGLSQARGLAVVRWADYSTAMMEVKVFDADETRGYFPT